MKKTVLSVIAAFLLSGHATSFGGQASPARYAAVEVKVENSGSPCIYLSRPVAIVYDRDNLYISDMDDDDIKVFAKSGAYRWTIGRQGQGPGELHRPGDIDLLDEKLYVADGSNRRIQILDKKGTYLAGFRVPFTPHRILVIDPDRIIVAHLPTGLSGSEKMLHCYNSAGSLLWEAVDSYFSGDAPYDLMRNRVFIKRSAAGNFFVIRGVADNVILRLSRDGEVLRKIEVEPGYPFREIAIPVRSGGRKSLRFFCWNCATDGERILLLVPEYTEDKDLGPGRQIVVLDPAGRTESYIDLPDQVTRIAVEGNTIYGIDLEGRLRLFIVVKK
jgi:hypothetical protein